MAVFTSVPDDELRAFWAAYDLPPIVRAEGILEGTENTNYRIHTAQDRYILTLYEGRVAAGDLPYFISLMQHLAAQGISCPQPLAQHDGTVLASLCGRPAVVTTFLNGQAQDSWSSAQVRSIGQALAQLHQAGQSFPLERSNALGLQGWRDLAEGCGTRADTLEPGLYRLIADEIGYLGSHWPEGLPRGLIHADLFPDNVFFSADEVSGLIDFYFACNDALAYDIAICLNAWCFPTHQQLDATLAAALLGGYESVRPLTPAERVALPLLCRAGALRFLLTRLYDWLLPDRANVKKRDPRQYLARLRWFQKEGLAL